MNYSSLIKFYSLILKELNFKIATRYEKPYIDNFHCNYRRFVLLTKEFFPLNYIAKNEVYFNPLSNNKNECSILITEDAVYKKIEHNIEGEFNNIIIKKCNEKKLNYYHIINKFKYIFRTIKVPFSKNIIQFTYNISNNDCKITLEYPLLKFLSTQNKNIVFGVHLEDYELEIFKYAYKSVIDLIDEEFQYTFKIPAKSNKFPEFYIIMKIYFQINESFKNIFSNKYHNTKNMLDNLNIFAFDSYSFSDDMLERNGRTKYIDYINKLIIQEQNQYQEELKIRQFYTKDWLFSKDNNMIKEKKSNLITQDEINKKFNNQYFNTYIQKISSFHANQDLERCINDIKYMKNNHEYSEILYLQQVALNIINGEGGRLWFDTRTKKYSFRSEYSGKIVHNDKKEITVILNRAMQKNLPKYHIYDKNSFNHMIEVVLIESISDIPKQILKDEYKADKAVKVLLFTSAIPSIDGDVFDITRNEEIFQSETDLLFKQNRFIPTEYLSKRYVNNNIEKQDDHEKSFIQNFIFQMVGENKEKATYILNWLAYSYQELKPTGSTLVFQGEQEVSNNLFFKRIIIEIFGKPYCSNIDDNSDYQTALIQDVAKDKLFLNICTINDAGTQFDDTSLALLIKELLIRPSISFTNDNNEQEELEIHSQVLITATNPAPYLKKALSKCSVFHITDIDTIISNLELEDEIELEDNILKDLDYFSDFLNCYKFNEQRAVNKLVTEERELLKDKKNETNINKEDRDSKIDDFIQAIIDKNLEYFVNVKGNKDKQGKDIYVQLENTFNKEEGYFVTNDLYLYFNAIYSDLKFKDNSTLLEFLKEKNLMFKQQYLKLTILDEDGNKEILFEKYTSADLGIGSKNLLKINGYKLPEDFTIKAGWFAETNDNSFKKYKYEDIESSKNARRLAIEKAIIR